MTTILFAVLLTLAALTVGYLIGRNKPVKHIGKEDKKELQRLREMEAGVLKLCMNHIVVEPFAGTVMDKINESRQYENRRGLE